MPRQECLDQLVAHHFTGAELRSYEEMTGGVSANVTRLDLALPDGRQRSVILREHGKTHCGHDLDVEFDLLSALHGAGLAVPEPLDRDKSCSRLEFPYLIMEYVAGSTDIPEDQMGARIAAMADHLAGLHSAKVAALPVLPMRVDPVPELFEFLPDAAKWDRFKTKLRSLENTAFAGAPMLLHGDFWPKNVIWTDASIAAVIDWEDAALGDPLSDVAAACLELRYIYGADGEDRFKSAYERHHAIDPYRFALWQAYVAAAGYANMGDWGLEPARLEAMRAVALGTIERAAERIGA